MYRPQPLRPRPAGALAPTRPKFPQPSSTPVDAKRKLGQVSGPTSAGPSAKAAKVRPSSGSHPLIGSLLQESEAPSGGEQPLIGSLLRGSRQTPSTASKPLGLKPSSSSMAGYEGPKPPPGRPPAHLANAKPAMPRGGPSGLPLVAKASASAARPGLRPTAAAARPGATPPKATAKAAVLPGSAQVAAQAAEKLHKGPGAGGGVSAKTQEIKQIVKMKKVDAFCKQLLEEWSSLAEDKKQESWEAVAAKMVASVPARFLRLIDMDAAKDDDAAQAAVKGKKAEPREVAKAPAVPPVQVAKTPSTALEAEPEEELAQAEEEEPFEEEVEQAPAEVEEEPFEEEEAAEPATDDLQDVRALLKQCQSLPEDRWPQLFKSQLGAQPEVEAVARVFEAAMLAKTKADRNIGSRFVVELTRNSAIQVKSITPALEVMAGKLEGLHAAGHECAWHVLSEAISHMFPRTPSTTWGLLRVGWNWAAWWSMVTKVLSSADPYRAFDITVLALQMMQDKSKCKVSQQGVWKDGGRIQKLKRTMCDWGQMDDHAVEDVLATHDINV